MSFLTFSDGDDGDEGDDDRSATQRWAAQPKQQ